MKNKQKKHKMDTKTKNDLIDACLMQYKFRLASTSKAKRKAKLLELVENGYFLPCEPECRNALFDRLGAWLRPPMIKLFADLCGPPDLPVRSDTECVSPHNQFIFWNVGQGLFYTGTLFGGAYNFVYDCGAEKYCSQHLDNAITDFTSVTPMIDFVVISHLHYDHCSGLFTLMEKSKVKKIYLPLLNNDIQLTLFVLKYYKSLAQMNAVDTRSYDVLEALYSRDESERFRLDVSFDGVEPVFIHKSFGFGFMQYWEFNLLAPHSNSKVKKFFMHNAATIQSMIKSESGAKFIQDFKKLKGYTNSIERALNNTSTVLLHKPLYHVNEPSDGIVSLLTGDINFTKTLALRIVRKAKGSKIRVFQIPHHGSNKNWTKHWNNGNVCPANMYVISFGYGNRHNLPDAQVINWLAGHKKKVAYVTQKKSYKYKIE